MAPALRVAWQPAKDSQSGPGTADREGAQVADDRGHAAVVTRWTPCARNANQQRIARRDSTTPPEDDSCLGHP